MPFLAVIHIINQEVFFMKRSCSLELTTTVGAAAAAISKNLTDDEVALLSAVLVLLGDSLALILAQRACEQSKTENKNG